VLRKPKAPPLRWYPCAPSPG